MFKNLTAVFVVLSLGGIFAMENPVFSNINPPDHTAKAFESMVKSINSGRDPIIKSITTVKADWHPLGEMAWSPDSRYIAVIMTEKKSGHSSVIVISRESNKIIKKLLLSEDIQWGSEPIAFSPDGHYLAAIVKDVIRLWDTKTWTKVKDIQGSSEKDPYTAFGPASLVFSPDNQNIACLFDTAFWWPPNEHRRGKEALEDAYGKIAQSKSNHAFWQDLNAGIIGESARTIAVFKISTGEKLFYRRTPRDTPVEIQSINSNLEYSSDGKYLLTAIRDLKTKNPQDPHGIEFAKLQLHNPKTGEIIKEINIGSPQNEIIALQSVNGQLFTAAKHQQALSPGTPVVATDPVRLWDENFNSPIKEFKTNLKKIESISVDKKGKLLVVFDGLSAEIWDVEKFNLLKQVIVNDRHASFCLISPDGKNIAATDMDRHIIRLIELK